MVVYNEFRLFMITSASKACVDLSAQSVDCERKPQIKRCTHTIPLTNEAKTLTGECTG